jgi:hypothetical protein
MSCGLRCRRTLGDLTEAPRPMAIDQLANALRGMPRSAPMLVATADGLRSIAMVRPGWLRGDGTPGQEGGQAVYSITLELGAPISRQTGSGGSEAP